jgi:hypothetical protein
VAYFGPGALPSPRTIARWRGDLANFRVSYVQYLHRTLPTFLTQGVSYDEERKELARLIALADRAATKAGIQPVVLPPPAFGGPILRGFTSVAFAHEDPRYQSPTYTFGPRPKPTFELTMDALDAVDGKLALMEADAQRRYRSPAFWADRILRAVLGFPVYLVSVILGFDPADLSTGFQRLLWLLSVVADIAAVFGLLKGIHVL